MMASGFSDANYPTVILAADLHINSTVGLWPPEVTDEDGTERPQNRFQKWLWKNWLEYCRWARRFRERVVVFNGDVVQGIHPTKDAQIVTTSAETMRAAAVRAMEPLIDGARQVYVVRGTEWHDNVGGGDAETVARELGAVRDPETGKYSRWALWLEYGGLFHLAHHIGIAPVYPATPMAQQLRQAKLEFVDHGQPLPDVIVRSHTHQYRFFPDGLGRWLFVTPAWQLKTAYVWKKNPLSLPDIGGLALWFEHGNLHWDAHLFPLPRPNVARPKRRRTAPRQKHSR